MGTAKEKDFKKALKDFNTFVPLVNNWAVNDSFCVEFRVMDMFRDEFLPYIKECIESFDEYRARVGLIMLLDHYLKVDMHGMKRPRMKKVTIKDIESTDERNCANGLYLDDIFSLVNRVFRPRDIIHRWQQAGFLLNVLLHFQKERGNILQIPTA